MTFVLAVLLLLGQTDNTSGLIIESETPQSEASYSLRARTKDGAHHIALEVRESSSPRSSRVRLTDTWTLPKN